MRRSFILILATIMVCRLQGQNIPVTDLYFMNHLASNPAAAGSAGALNAMLQYRDQWAGFDNAPKNFSLLTDAPIGRHNGVGILLRKNTEGATDETAVLGNYAYNLELARNRLAFGIGFGGTWCHVNWNSLQAVDPDDAVLTGQAEKAFLPDFSLGTYYYGERFYAGLSLPFFMSHEYNHSTGKYATVNRFIDYQYDLTGGYTFAPLPGLKVIPSFLASFRPHTDPVIYADIQSAIKDKVWLGIGYHRMNVLAASVQLQLTRQLRLAYAYDYDLGSLGQYKNGSHELALNYLFTFDREVTGPRQF